MNWVGTVGRQKNDPPPPRVVVGPSQQPRSGDPDVLFDLLDEERTNELGIATFIEGVMKLRGAANAKDLMQVVVQT